MDYPIVTAVNGIVAANGTATVQIGPQYARESWDLDTVTMTGLNMVLTISQYGQVIDSTANDPRPTVTTNTPYHLPTGGVIVCQWTGGTPGQVVQVAVNGTKHVGAQSAVL